MMRSSLAVVTFVMCALSPAHAFVAPLGQMCASARHSSIRLARTRTTTLLPRLSMSSVTFPPSLPSSTTHEPVRSNIQRVRTNEDFIEVLAEHNDKVVVVKFYDKFCRACDEIRPRFEELSQSVGSDEAMFYEIEFSGSKDLCKQLGIKRLPTVQMYAGADGRVADLPAGPSRFNQVVERFTEVSVSRNKQPQEKSKSAEAE